MILGQLCAQFDSEVCVQVMTDCSNISFTSDALHTKWPIGIPAPRVWIYPNDGGISATPEPVIVDGSLAQLLLFAAEILNDDTVQISHFTTTRGLRVRRVDQLKNNMELTAIPVDHKFVARVPQYGPAASSGAAPLCCPTVLSLCCPQRCPQRCPLCCPTVLPHCAAHCAAPLCCCCAVCKLLLLRGLLVCCVVDVCFRL